jgi:protein-S-isoprenylcysteine O-methyltransferase Ste14
MSADDVALAERLTLRRARVSTVLALFFLLTMATSLGTDVPLSRPETFKLAAWVLWAAALLFLLATGGGLSRSAAVRGLMNDDSTIENRRNAMVAGFWATVLTAFVLYAVSLFETVSGRDAIRLMLSAAVACSVLRFGQLERRALKHG